MDGSYEQAVRIMRMDKLIDRYICRFGDGDTMERLLAASENMDAEGLFEGAHAMKGVCGNLGLDRLSRAAGELAEEFRPGSARNLSDDEVREKVRGVGELYRHTLACIRQYEQEKA
jgi:Hpt domain.